MDTLLTLLALALILLPGWVLWLHITGPQPSTEVAITGLAFASAIAMVVLYAISYVGLTWFVVVWLAALAWAAYRLAVLRPRIRVDGALALLMLGAAAVRFLPVLVQIFPPGWDPYFHLLIVRLIEQSGAHVASLSPFEDIPINYPTGTHLLIALIVKVTGASRYGVYQAFLASFSTLTCLQVYAWVHAASGNRRWALYALAAYAFLAVQGSIGYYEWGGVPNLVGMYVLAGCFTLVAQSDAGERRWWALPPMYLAIALANHHVLMAAFGAMLALLVWLALRPERRADARRLLLGGCIAGVIAAPALVLHFHASGEAVGATGLLTVVEPPNTLWVIATGYGLVFFGAMLAGGALYARAPRLWALRPELLAPAIALLVLFVLFEQAGRLFTPSRFVTDLVYPLSAFAGLAFLALERRFKRPLLPLVVLLFAANGAHYVKQFQPVIEPDRLAAYRWIEANTRPDTMVIDIYVHAPVLTNRISSYTALPSSELVGQAKNRRLLERMQTGEVQVERTPYPVVLLVRGELPRYAPPEAVVWRGGEFTILDVNPRVSARLPARQ